MNVAVLIPVKRFAAAKGRLGPVLAAPDRARLARWLASGVVEAAGTSVFVACDDPDVRGWAESVGAGVLWGPDLGLNGAIDDGVASIRDLGFDHLTVAHADLPRPRSLPSVVRADTITLVPDDRRDGTNVMSFPLRRPVAAAYGASSFHRHLAAAMSGAGGGIGVEVRADRDLALDVDTPADLSHPLIEEVLPPWLRTSLANPRSMSR